eukprot:3383251-Prymnesium_polylepis.1
MGFPDLTGPEIRPLTRPNEHPCAYHALERPHNAKTCMRKRPRAEEHPAEAHGACPERCTTHTM